MEGSRLDGLRIARGGEALAVVLFHASQQVSGRIGAERFPELTAGAFGVDVFFALSGFLMVHTTRASFGRASSALRFARSRVRRVVPLYWVMTLCTVLYQVVANSRSPLLDDLGPHLACSLSFLPCSRFAWPLVIQGWTLDYEMAFYALFALCMPWNRWVLVALGSALVAVGAASSAVAGWPSWYPSDSLLIEFAAGMLAAEAYARRPPVRVPDAAIRGVVAASAVFAVASATSIGGWIAWRGVVWGIPAALTVGACALYRSDRTGGRPGPLRVWSARLGDASYSLYLSHMLAFTMLSRVALGLLRLGLLGGVLYFALCVAAAVLLGFVVHRHVEVPLSDLAGRWSGGGRTEPRAAEAG